MIDLSPLIGLFFPARAGGLNTGGGKLGSLTGEGEPSTLDAAVDEEALEEVEENEFVEPPDVDRSVFKIDFADDDPKEDPPEDDEELPESVNEEENE